MTSPPVRLRLVSLSLLVASFLAACVAGEERSALPSASVGPDPTSPSPSASPAPAAPKEQLVISVNGDSRQVDLFRPSAIDETADGEPLPLLVLLHGNNGAPRAMAATVGADTLAERESVVIALPPARPGGRWDAEVPEDAPVTDSPDVAFVAGLIERLLADYPVDPERVYVAGFSMGAVLAGRIACQRADLVAAVALDAGTRWGGPCQPTRRVSVLVMHGTTDTTFPLADAQAFADLWRTLNDCGESVEESMLTDAATAWTSIGCADGSAVQFVSIEGVGHGWFRDPSATELAWDFLTTTQRAP